ncbi:hypothetical protein WA026_008229 [Henosepilachna vigintioctopunctata]|uniref:Sialin n=1 Tax=Henosepilachna vigintioctopunctata TaxID=420089 RepID=A0AAW1TQM6_9CUCU
MTENKSITSNNGSTVYVRSQLLRSCSYFHGIFQYKEFDWNSKMQGYVLSSFFYGYITTQLLGGWLASRIGGKTLFGVGVGATAMMTVITPFVAKMNIYLLIALRTLEGIFEGVTYPAMHAVWSQWAPPLERSRLSTIAMSGAYAGTVISMLVCALLAEWFGWQSIFYVFGVVGLIWFAVWQFVVSEKPREDMKISKEELKYITTCLGSAENEVIDRPWKSILTSVPVWAIVAANFTENWGFYTFLTQLPKYMKDILNFDLAKTGIMTALPYLAMTIMLPLSGQLADRLLLKNLLTATQVRKLFTCGAFLAQAVFVLCASYVSSVPAVLICLILAGGFGSFAYAGYCVNYLDVAPKHASILMGIGNTFGSLPGILSPIFFGYVVTTPTKQEWQIVFFVSSGIYLTGCVVYGLFSSGELQAWAENPDNRENEPKSLPETNISGMENSCFQYDI